MTHDDLLNSHDWTFPVPIAYGPGRLCEIAGFCSREGMKNPLIVTDKGSRNLPFIADAQRYLLKAGIGCGIYSDVSPNPHDVKIAAGRAQYRSGNHNGIIAIGGGSGMDGGKAVALIANNHLALWDFEFEKTPPVMSVKPPFPPLICVPTTAGTGAETESTAMITESARQMKLCVWHPDLKPCLALLDPEITVNLPINLPAWTGCDAMVHAIEAYCVPTFHPMCDSIALKALAMVSTHLRSAVEHREDIAARGGMLVGSCLAGVSFLKGLGLVHAISHMVGAEFDTHHGLTNAIILPAVLRFNAPSITLKIQPMATAMGLEDTSFEGFYQSVCNVLDDLSIPKRLVEIGVPDTCAARIAQKAQADSAAQTNPRAAAVSEIKAVINQALTLGR